MPQCFHPTRNLEVNISQMAFSDKGLLQKRERTHLPSPKNSWYLRTFDGQIRSFFKLYRVLSEYVWNINTCLYITQLPPGLECDLSWIFVFWNKKESWWSLGSDCPFTEKKNGTKISNTLTWMQSPSKVPHSLPFQRASWSLWHGCKSAHGTYWWLSLSPALIFISLPFTSFLFLAFPYFCSSSPIPF